jgi:squalene-hopene/tetraprenyl-beta-curcumene cyclase
MVLSLGLLASVTANTVAQPKAKDPYDLPPPDAKQDTADEPFIDKFSVQAAAGYLDARAHLVESNCFACHSTFTFLPARSAIDPLAKQVMETRVLLERFTAMCLDKAQIANVKTNHIPAVRVLAAVELARHDAATTGKLQPITRQALDYLWQLQRADGGVNWVRVGEAPQAIDDYWPVAMMAIGAGTAPEGYAQTEKARAGIEKLRGWLRAHPPTNAHERGLTLLAHASIGGLLSEEERRQHTEAIFALQLKDGGWSMAGLAAWERPDKKPLDPTRSDGYGTGFVTYVLARSGVAPTEPRLHQGIEWLKTNQRRSGGWFTPSPFKRDKIASNTGTSFAVQALAACGEIPIPKVSAEQFAAAHAAADKAVPAGVYLPNPK